MEKGPLYIFGYGSLVDLDKLKIFLQKETFLPGELFICKLKGYRRIWNVSMDNKRDLPNYKYYTESINGKDKRPPYFVTFLNIEKYIDSEVMGVLFKVDQKMLEKLKIRESHYKLINIKTFLNFDFKDQAYTFTANQEGLENFKKGEKKDLAVISKNYFNLVEEAFKNLEENKSNLVNFFPHLYNENFFHHYHQNTYKKENIPIRPLSKVNLK